MYWWRVRCLDEDGNALGVWSEARRMEMPVDGWETGLFGDSISHGGGRMSFSPSDALYNLGFYLDESTVNLAQSGDTSRRMAERFEADVLPFRLRYLLIMGGTNSLRGGEDPEAVIGDLRYIGDKCRKMGSSRFISLWHQSIRTILNVISMKTRHPIGKSAFLR